MGTVSNITNMPRQTILDFYHTFYAPSNATLILAGRITPDEGLALAQKDLRSLARPRRA